MMKKVQSSPTEFYEPPCAWLLVAQNAEHESSDRECSDGLKSRLAARFAKRSDAAGVVVDVLFLRDGGVDARPARLVTHV